MYISFLVVMAESTSSTMAPRPSPSPTPHCHLQHRSPGKEDNNPPRRFQDNVSQPSSPSCNYSNTKNPSHTPTTRADNQNHNPQNVPRQPILPHHHT
mmetsp:Transcript_3721/g.8351  ORF Transcript_3721/g.8351 Transcript_3721/m.8351 type:complete len:97 (-) Transcript_3721:448-738(-)